MLLLYVSGDYCNPWIPGAFSVTLESFFVEGLKAPEREPDAVIPVVMRSLVIRPTLETITRPVPAAIPPCVVSRQYSLPRVHVVALQPPPSCGSLDDH
jgi:hypothetical protein